MYNVAWWSGQAMTCYQMTCHMYPVKTNMDVLFRSDGENCWFRLHSSLGTDYVKNVCQQFMTERNSLSRKLKPYVGRYYDLYIGDWEENMESRLLLLCRIHNLWTNGEYYFDLMSSRAHTTSVFCSNHLVTGVVWSTYSFFLYWITIVSVFHGITIICASSHHNDRHKTD